MRKRKTVNSLDPNVSAHLNALEDGAKLLRSLIQDLAQEHEKATHGGKPCAGLREGLLAEAANALGFKTADLAGVMEWLTGAESRFSPYRVFVDGFEVPGLIRAEFNTVVERSFHAESFQGEFHLYVEPQVLTILETKRPKIMDTYPFKIEAAALPFFPRIRFVVKRILPTAWLAPVEIGPRKFSADAGLYLLRFQIYERGGRMNSKEFNRKEINPEVAVPEMLKLQKTRAELYERQAKEAKERGEPERLLENFAWYHKGFAEKLSQVTGESLPYGKPPLFYKRTYADGIIAAAAYLHRRREILGGKKWIEETWQIKRNP